MSKIVAGTAFVLLAGATVTGGVLLLNKGSNSAEGTGQATEEQFDSELSTTLDAFKTTDKTRERGCVKKLFGTMTALTGDSGNEMAASDISNTPNPFFGGADKSTEGCLVVNWDKKSKTESESSTKWNGTFRLLWAIKGESKGFLAFLVGTTKKENSGGKLDWSGVGYLLTKENQTSGTTQTWTETKQLKVKTDSKFPNSETDTAKFPAPGTALNITNNPTFWGFFSAAGELDKLDEANKPDGDGTKNESLRAYWKWDGKESASESSSPKKLLDWTTGFDKWWKEVFDDTKFKIKDVLENQKGTWTQQVYTLFPGKTQQNSP